MRPVQIITFSTLLYFGVAQDTTTNDDLNHKTNTIEAGPSVRLDPYIRKALLKALSDLEEDDSFTDTDSTDSILKSNTETANTNNEFTVAQANKENIQIHSFVVNGQAAFDNSSETTPMLIDNKISILSTTVGNVENYVTASLPTQAPFQEIFQTKETGVNLQQTRSIPSSAKSSTGNLVSSSSKLTTSKNRGISTTTTSTTTTTTTPKPTHNEDGENIEEVNKKDVQVFQAPLVAAFTVHQDAQGVPKKVIPIYQQSNNQGILKPSPTLSTPTNIIAPSFLTPAIPTANIQRIPSTEFINQQLTLQKQLEEKQLILEHQLRLLQIQQRQQEELLRNQQLLLQQKEAQRLQQALFEQEQFKRQKNIGEQQQLPSNQISNTFNVQNNSPHILGQNNVRPQNSQVSIQPSITLDQANTLAPQQQLPNREAVDFLIHLREQQQTQFPLQENHLPQGITNFLQPNPVQNFNQVSNFQLTNQLRPDDQQGQKQGNRVFRHESSVGNFGINQNYNRLNTFESPFSNRFLTNRFNQFSRDSELKQLLAQSNINTRAHEDLNIVSKVLSLNHGIPLNNVANRLAFDNRRPVRTFA
ncbi:unnamed protein product, partial [Brenthis ino]